MAVVVRNETGSDFYFGTGSAKKIVHDQGVATISEDEWATVATSKRGTGGVRCLWPTETDSAETRTKLDYYSVGGTNQVRYLGTATQDASTAANLWTVKRFDYTDLGSGDVRATDIQVLINVAWDNRAALGWS